MRQLTPIAVLVAFAACCSVSAQQIASDLQVASDTEIAAARRELAAAKLDAQLFWDTEYECARRELNASIRVSDEEVRTMRRQLKYFGPFNPYAYGQLPEFHYRNARLFLAEAEARRNLLISERNNLRRTYANKFALLQLNVAAARDRLVELSGGGTIELSVAE